MRVYFFTSKLNFRTSGGSIEEIDYILRNLLSLGHEVTAVTAYSSRNDMPDPPPYRVIEEHMTSQRLISVQRDIYRLLKKYSNDADFFIIDAHNFMYGAGAYRLLGGRVPVCGFVNQFLICWPQYISSYFPQQKDGLVGALKRKLRWLVEKHIGMRFADGVNMFAYVSPTLRAMYEEFGMRASERDFVIGDPIDIRGLMERGGITEHTYRDHLKLERTTPLMIFYSSRMSPGKGFDMLLQGFSRVKNKDDFRVVLGGTGPEERSVRNMVRDLRLEKYVTLAGWTTKEQLYEHYREADMFIQADWWPAGTSISLLYALAFGVPSILPGGGGLEWNAGKSALYFPYRDPEALARRIEEMGANPDLRAELSAHCYTRLAEPDVDYPARIRELSDRMEHIHAL